MRKRERKRRPPLPDAKVRGPMKCSGAYRRHKWDPETGKCVRCRESRNPKAKPLKRVKEKLK